MRLRPLKQFICDCCNEIIEQPEQGYLEWLADYKDYITQVATNKIGKKSSLE